ncbi:MAG TPA: DUF817 family protein, partial [Asticcacaulis sp.]
AAVWFRSFIFFRVDHKTRSMPFLLANCLSAFFLWVAENIGAYTNTWRYPGKDWHIVAWQKMGAWALLLVLAFVTVTLVVRPQAPESEAERAGGYRLWRRGFQRRPTPDISRPEP